jgi:sugar phosphate isomerase/epimerase
MSIDRRTFLGTVTAACVAAPFLGAESVRRVGVQLYTVRDELSKDFDGTLAKIASIGFKEVEFAGYAKQTPQQVRDALARHGLTAPAAHVQYDALGETWPAVLESARTIGHRYLVNPWIDESLRKQPDIWKKVADTFNRAGEAAAKAGIQFAYHNHHFEFVPVDGKSPYDYLLETCDPKLVKMELDLCWVAVAGKDPLEYFKRYPGRFPLVHVKGLTQAPAGGASAPIDKVLPTITDVGQKDVIDWKRIFAQSRQAGIEHYFVEHDVPKSPFDSLKSSYDYVSKLTF